MIEWKLLIYFSLKVSIRIQFPSYITNICVPVCLCIETEHARELSNLNFSQNFLFLIQWVCGSGLLF